MAFTLLTCPALPAGAVDHSNLDEQRPLRLEDPYPIAAGEWALETGVGFRLLCRGGDRGVFPLEAKVSVGVCSAEERALLASGHAEPCEIDVVISDGPSPRAVGVVPIALSSVAVLGAPWLVWHCGTPDPAPPSIDALTVAVRAALRFRAPPAG